MRLLLLIGCCCAATAALAADVVAKSGAATDIQETVALAHPGDTITIPEGRFLFHGQVFLPDGVTVRGAGKDKTLLVKTDRLDQWKPMFSVDCRTGQPFVFSDLTLQGAGRDLQGSDVPSDRIRDQGLVLRGRCRDFRIYGSRFTKFSRAGIELVGDDGSIHGEQRGVIFDNEFIDNWSHNLGYGVAVNGIPAAWQQPPGLGTQEAVFVEDNYFESNRCAIIANNGAHYVFRHNRIVNNQADSAPIYAHGKVSSWPRGTRSFEIYDNKLTNDQQRWAGIALGGGEGVIFNNDLSGVIYGIIFMIEGNTASATKYPYPDQISKTWVWQNNANGLPVTSVTLRASPGVNVSEFLQQGRDFFVQAKQDYHPFPYPHPLRSGQ
jgi:hypothetical protein